MRTITLDRFGPIVSDKQTSNEISLLINNELERNQHVVIDLSGIKSMATFCSKQIFGRLYLSLGAQKFYDKIKISNATEDIKLLIQIGIENALEEEQGALSF